MGWATLLGECSSNFESRSLAQPQANPAFFQSQLQCPRRSCMKRLALHLFFAFLAGSGWLVPLAKAQDHYQGGRYCDYFLIDQTDTTMAGLGRCGGYKVFPCGLFGVHL